MWALPLTVAWLTPGLSVSEGIRICRESHLPVPKLVDAEGAVAYMTLRGAGAVFFCRNAPDALLVYKADEAVEIVSVTHHEGRMRGNWAHCRSEIFEREPKHYLCCSSEGEVLAFFSG